MAYVPLARRWLMSVVGLLIADKTAIVDDKEFPVQNFCCTLDRPPRSEVKSSDLNQRPTDAKMAKRKVAALEKVDVDL